LIESFIREDSIAGSTVQWSQQVCKERWHFWLLVWSTALSGTSWAIESAKHHGEHATTSQYRPREAVVQLTLEF
jgi:hypothetical protein